MRQYAELVLTPDRSILNPGLSPADSNTLLNLLGPPERLTSGTEEMTTAGLETVLETRDVGPFTVTGLTVALDSLEELFSEVAMLHPELYDALGTTGMLSSSGARGSPARHSPHYWGIAIDLTIDGLETPPGSLMIPRGLLALYSYFHSRGWYWGTGFHPVPRPMHFELADETIRRLTTPP
jgi:hypothetical protein